MKELLPLFSRPCRYAGDEWGAVRKDPRSVRVRLALAFPDLYEIGMSYMGQRILYDLVNRVPEYVAERVFAPCEDTARLLREHHTPMATLETDTPLAAMDAVGFSLTQELCATNVLSMLDLAGIPLWAAERGERHPLILAGGGACFNPEPVAEFFDAVVLGDGEAALPAVLAALDRAKRERLSRAALLDALAALPGVYVPSLFADQGPNRPLVPLKPGYERVAKAVAEDLETAPFPTRHVLPSVQAVHDRLAIEVTRGCTRGCRFCQAGMVYRPVRERSVPRLVSLLEQGLAATGYEEISFLSLSTGDYTALEGLFAASFPRCAAEQVAISLPSLRVGSLSAGIMERIAGIRRTGATIAPEAGSQRLRDVINKNVSEQDLLAHVAKLFGQGWQMVKLYFMIGLPGETDEDLAAILDLCRKVRDAAGPGIKRLQITASVSPFVPKPHTPFQWEEQIGLAETWRRIEVLKDLFAPHKRLALKFHQPEMSFIEGVFARGDRRLSRVVLAAYRAGAVFSSWKDKLSLAPYLAALAESGLDPDSFLSGRDPAAPLPWDHLDCGVSREFLLRERERALAGKTSPDCRDGTCLGCGVCNHDGRSSNLVPSGAPVSIRPRLAEEVPPGPAAPPAEKTDLHAKAGRFRVWFRKTGPAAYLSQLELQRLFERAMRRARIPLSFSEGFHPLPRMSFGRALPVGVESLCEWFDLTLREQRRPEDLLAALAAQFPPGLAPYQVEPLPEGRKRPQPVAEEFVVRFSGRPEDLARWREAWLGLTAKGSFVILREGKQGTKRSDIRPLVREVRPQGEDAVAVVFDWSGEYVNPLVVARKVAAPIGPLDFGLTKTRQIF